jgi:OmpA-OmpF porin, OOP family
MIKSGRHVLWMVALPITLVLATTGCASKKYVRNQVAPVDARVNQLQAQTKEQISYLNNKEQTDMAQLNSQMNERIATTDQKISEVSAATEAAQGSASRAMEESTANTAKIDETNASVNALGAGVANALNYQEVEKADVTFATNKTTLTPEAEMALDQIAAKVQSLPRAEIELVGFTDKSGSKERNLVLSRRRAEAVQRYLVMKNVPLRSIKIIGLGEEAPPPGLQADLKMVVANPTPAENARLARRVHIRVFGAGDITSGTASRTPQ